MSREHLDKLPRNRILITCQALHCEECRGCIGTERVHEIVLDRALLDVPAPHVIHSEYTPSVVETISAQENIASRQAALRTVHDVLQFYPPTAELWEYWKGLSRALELFTGVLSPIRRLPDEILREIFIHFHNARQIRISCVSTTLLREGDPLHTIIHVCSRWNRISCSTPHLWTNILYDLSQPYEKDLARLMAFGERLLVRSRQVPLSMDFINLHVQLCWTARAARSANPQVLEALASSNVRWRRLAINPYRMSLLQDLGVIPPILPILTTLILSTYSAEPATRPLPPFPSRDPLARNMALLRAPNIEHVKLKENCRSQSLFPKLGTYNHLETLTVTLQSSYKGAIPLGEVLFMPLTSLNISTQVGNALLWLFEGLRCPNLRRLSIRPQNEEGIRGAAFGLNAFLKRSGCQLDQFSLSQFSSDPFIDLLDLQFISRLYVSLSQVTIPDVNHRLAQLASRSGTCQLSSLWIRVESDWPIGATPFSPIQALTDLYKARVWKTTEDQYAEIRLEFKSPLEDQVKEQLASFCNSTQCSPIRVSYADDSKDWHSPSPLEDLVSFDND
ncbi:hypothetical protein BKA70DRAFT_1281016 [Coprinopsis sp. MPI-PUGE-AT-0042]|nr:hypothetical protein BKA70DRAFT_1281016 [Coprinopsis sp. MPI-PUGE-AT-0042]